MTVIERKLYMRARHKWVSPTGDQWFLVARVIGTAEFCGRIAEAYKEEYPITNGYDVSIVKVGA